MKDKFDVIVIGGGASGMMSSIFAAEAGARVLVIEKNMRLGEKVRISGGGRCNLLNMQIDKKLLLANYGDRAKFLHSAFERFGLDETVQFFDDLGLKIKVEAKNRAFPMSNDANEVVGVIERRMKELGVEVLFGSVVKDIMVNDQNVLAVHANKEMLSAKSYILATGGYARPETGSTGDGFKWLNEMGLRVKKPSPNITPLKIMNYDLGSLGGKVLKSCSGIFYQNGKRLLKIEGDILLTHFGLSGPLILNNSAKVGKMLTLGKVNLKLDLMPKLDHGMVDQELVKSLGASGKVLIKNWLKKVLPGGVDGIIKIRLAGSIDFEAVCAEMTREQRLLIRDLIKSVDFEVESLMGFEKAVVADGGIDLSEVDMRTFRVKKFNNLYVTGDILDINRPSGGFSLQLCWTSGAIAGAESVMGVEVV